MIFEDTALWLQIANKFPPTFYMFNSFVYRVHLLNSVNWKEFNYGLLRVSAIKKFMKSNRIIVKDIGIVNFNREISSSYFTIVKHYIFKNKNRKAILFLFYSILLHPSTYQLKHRILILFRLCIFSNNIEYKNYIKK